VGRQLVVVYFYAGDFSGCCSERCQRLRETLNGLAVAGVCVVGISGDSQPTHALFKSIFAVDYSLLADEQGTVAKRFGVPMRAGGKARAMNADGTPYWSVGTRDSLIVRRQVTCAEAIFVIGKDGTLVYRSTCDDPVDDGQAVRRFIDQFAGK
jgi:peroxiredoxin Q/BCP